MSTAIAPISKLELASGRLRILQLLRTIAAATPNAESKRKLGEMLTHPAIDERTRALITQLHSDDPARRQAIGLILGEALNSATSELHELIANGEGDEPASAPAAPAPAPAPAPPSALPAEFANSPAPAPTPPAPTPVPVVVSVPLAGLAGCEEVELQAAPVDGVEQPKLRYSIVRTDGPVNADLLRGQRLSALRGLVVGYKGQGSVVEGYGWIFPIEPVAFAAEMQENATHTARAHLPIAMKYPQMLAYFDPHALDSHTSSFLAAHQLFKDGFRLLLRVDAVPYASRVMVTTQPHRYFDQTNAEGQLLAVSTLALNNLEHGFSDVEVIGVLLEVNHG